MKYTVEAKDACRRAVTVEIDAQEVDAGFAHTYADFAYRFPSAAPDQGNTLAAIDQTFGADAVAATTGKALCDEWFGRVLGLADLVKISEPTFVAGTPPVPGEPFSFSAEVDCTPQLELSSYDAVCVRLPAMGSGAAAVPALQKLRENEALHALQARLVGDVPEIMVDMQEQVQLQSVYAKAAAQNMPFEKYLIQQRIDPDQFNAELEQQAAEAVRRNLALDAWARAAGIDASDEQVRANFERSGVPYPALEEALWRENGRIAELRAAIRRSGALRDVMAGLKVETI